MDSNNLTHSFIARLKEDGEMNEVKAMIENFLKIKKNSLYLVSISIKHI